MVLADKLYKCWAQPFFFDNFALRFLYKSILEDDKESTQRKMEVAAYETCLQQIQCSGKDTDPYFHTEGLPLTRSFDLVKKMNGPTDFPFACHQQFGSSPYLQ